jgi:hypothetical protein
MNCYLGIGKSSKTWRSARREDQKDVGLSGWLRINVQKGRRPLSDRLLAQPVSNRRNGLPSFHQSQGNTPSWRSAEGHGYLSTRRKPTYWMALMIWEPPWHHSAA